MKFGGDGNFESSKVQDTPEKAYVGYYFKKKPFRIRDEFRSHTLKTTEPTLLRDNRPGYRFTVKIFERKYISYTKYLSEKTRVQFFFFIIQ